MIHVEPWPTTTSGPYLIADEPEGAGDSPIVEGDGALHAITPTVGGDPASRVAFVDGVRDDSRSLGT